MPKWLKQVLYSVIAGALAAVAVKNPVVFTPDIQATILTAVAVYLGLNHTIKE